MSEPRTLQEICDWFAARDGWNKPGTKRIGKTGCKLADPLQSKLAAENWWKIDADGNIIARIDHPYPATLDGAHGAMPSGVRWIRHYDNETNQLTWKAFPTYLLGGTWLLIIQDSGDNFCGEENPAHDLYSLAYLAEKKIEALTKDQG